MKVLSIPVSIFLFALVLLIHANGKHISKRVVNGDEVKPHSLPYLVAIRTTINDKDILCGGSLIARTLVLTAAKCVYGAPSAELILGAHDLSQEEETQVKLTSSKFIFHPKYSNTSLLRDIAVIQLPSPVTLNENIATIAIPELGDIFNNYIEKLGLVAGWGKAHQTDTTTSNVLRYVEVTIIPTIICELSYIFSITLDQLCTTGVSKKNICLGDAGSPLVVDGMQVGIASYGSDFGCESGFPGVFTRMTAYVGWLRVNIDS